MNVGDKKHKARTFIFGTYEFRIVDHSAGFQLTVGERYEIQPEYRPVGMPLPTYDDVRWLLSVVIDNLSIKGVS